MASDKRFLDFIIEKLNGLQNITYKKMMGEYLLYCDGVLCGGIYDNRLLLKKTKSNALFDMPEELPYNGAKPMYLVDCDDNDALKDIILSTVNDLKNKK